ncbi:MAG: AAA family ATPase [Actinomycetaceae bacterium]|nr:AAA family ATPase [Arcanobacterium sp.]MDD7505808.1 AAA family ATPase [Actinomycetaceae bacterium]MDY6142881.1 AAA family ATPase [Arcanobacterium sp.]
MYLKNLTLRGFKSFATSTAMNFEPGINCVVGPNGSGKSNVVDALAWVMGEQGAKTLRGGAMQDVIFAGTDARPPLGRAEVRLTIDNTDGKLPIEYSEVTISRTLFRSGGSEYAINGTAARLLDIQELLSDSGLGREMHVIIGQGRLDQVLTATPEERRGFVEEAAGVLKHRRRKEKALRKLESMRGNLTRIEDLAAELRRQLGPLARQAATARRAQTIQADLFDAKARLLADDIAQAQARLESQRVDGVALAKQREALAESIAAGRADVERYQRQIDAANPELARLTERWQRLNSLAERFRSLEQLAGERVKSLEQQGPDIFRGESPEHIRERAAQARDTENDLRKQAAAASDALNTAVAARESAESEERATENELTHVTRALSDHRENHARLEGAISAARSRAQALDEEREHVEAALKNAQRRLSDAASQITASEQEAVAHSDADDQISASHDKAAQHLYEAKNMLDQAREAKSAARAAEAEWRTKADTLEMSLLPEDATAWAVNNLSAAHTLVRAAVRIVPGWESAIETALGQVTQGVVVASVAEAVDALRGAREAEAGHLEILIAPAHSIDGDNASDADTASGGHAASKDETLVGSRAVDDDAAHGNVRAADVRAADVLKRLHLDESRARRANDVATGEGAVARSLRSMLAGVIVCADLVTAREVVHAGGAVAVTVNGEMICATHASGGEHNSGALLARASVYDDATREAQHAREAYERAARAEQDAEVQVGQAQEAYDAIASELAARDSKLAAVRAQLGILRQTLRSAEQEVERSQSRLTKIDAERAQRETEIERLESERRTINDAPEELQARGNELKAVREVQHKATVQARLEETEARLALRTREERLRAVVGKAESLEKQAGAVEQRIAQERRLAERRAQAAGEARQVGEFAGAAMRSAQLLVDRTFSERQAMEEARAGRDAELAAARKYLDERLAEQRELDDLHHRRELALAEIRLGYEQLASKAIDDVGMEPATLVNEYGPHRMIDVPDSAPIAYVREQQEKRLARAQKDLARLGKINPLALEEHAALEERQKYLTEQLQDLRQSREDLLTIVSDIDKRVAEVMRSAFDDVSREFTDVFGRLFPGGEGKLVLTEPDDLLTTGIDIEARPPGKRVKRLSLLSGGERSLTAIAFLVAIFKARPSPFYVMDEVEAALDDVNLSRLLDIFRELQTSSQLIVITHQKRTMEIADVLYGVAMKEKGVTTVISQRLKDVMP